MYTMEQPPLTEAPLEWLQTVVRETDGFPDDKTFDIHIKSVEDEQTHTFTYALGGIRAELQTRTSS